MQIVCYFKITILSHKMKLKSYVKIRETTIDIAGGISVTKISVLPRMILLFQIMPVLTTDAY